MATATSVLKIKRGSIIEQIHSVSDFESEFGFPFRQSYFIKFFDASLQGEFIQTFCLYISKEIEIGHNIVYYIIRYFSENDPIIAVCCFDWFTL